jgi:PAS domain S-box-containing protein
MEAEMKKSEEKYRSIIENIQDVYYRTDHDGNLIMASPSGLTLLGYRSFVELLGRPIAEALYHEPEKRRIFLAALHERGFVRNYEVVLREKDGTPVVVSTNSHYYYDTNGEIAGVEGVFQDITERKRAEAALYQANKKLTMLASITRHDIMNKITGLSISNDLAKNLTKNKKLLEILDTVDNTIRAIVRQIEFTRTYENLATSTPEWQSVNDIVSRAVAQFDLIGVTVTNETGGLEVYADPMLEKVFYNLTDNALRHGEKISEIKARYEKTGDGITIIFEDNGAGIPEPDKEEIFKKGYGKNSGLGLFISKEILAITGLSIRETGVPGEGARFEMTIPKRAYRLTTAD